MSMGITRGEAISEIGLSHHLTLQVFMALVNAGVKYRYQNLRVSGGNLPQLQ